MNLNCDFASTFCDRPLRSQQDEDEMVASFFNVQSFEESVPSSVDDGFDARRDDRFAYDDELLDHDYPAVASSRITVYTRDASYDSIYSQHAEAAAAAAANDVPSRWATSYRQPQQRRQEAAPLKEQQFTPPSPPRDEFASFEGASFVPVSMPSHSNDLLADLGEEEAKQQQQPSNEGVQFVPGAEEDFFSSCCATDGGEGGGEGGEGGGIDTTKQLATIAEDEAPFRFTEDLPGDEYDVELERDDATMLAKNSRQSKQRSGRGPFYSRHRLPSQHRARASSLIATRQRKLLKSFLIVALAFIVAASFIAYFVLRDQTEATQDSPAQQAKDDNNSVPTAPIDGSPTAPISPPSIPISPSTPTVTATPTIPISPTFPSSTTAPFPPTIAPLPPTTAPFPPTISPISNPTMSPAPASTLAPTIRNVEAILNSETYDIISSVVDDQDALLDLDTPQGKAFELVYEQYNQDSQGRALAKIPEEEEYRMIQRYVLMVLYYGTGGDDLWIFNLGWRDFEDDECDWVGVVSCGAKNAVTNITLARTKVMGTLPTELCLMTELEALVLNRNLLTGTIPECLAALPKLKQLDLRGNDLSGPLPDGVFASTSLVSLDLSRNEFSGNVGTPPQFSIARSQVASNSKLKTIRLDNNRLSGEIDNIFIYFNELETLTLHDNNLVGGIDALCTHPLKEFTADCDELTCTCCTQCFNGDP